MEIRYDDDEIHDDDDGNNQARGADGCRPLAQRYRGHDVPHLDHQYYHDL